MAQVQKTQEQSFLPTAMDGASAENAGAVLSADRHGWRKCRKRRSSFLPATTPFKFPQGFRQPVIPRAMGIEPL
jgi:hypothetical protein